MTKLQRDWKQFVLLLIDVQQDFWTPARAQSFPHFPANTAKLLNICRTEGIEVVHLRASFKPDKSDWMLRHKLLGRTPCIQGTAGIETLSCALAQPHEVVMPKQTFDGFQNPALLQHLRQNEKRFVLVAGLITSTCVLFTATSAAQSGFLVTIVDDCCADEPVAHEHTLSRYRFIFSRTSVDAIATSYAEWLSSLKQLDEAEVEYK